MKKIRRCQPENKPESTKFDQHVEMSNRCFGEGFPHRHKNIGNKIIGENENRTFRRLRRNTDCSSRTVSFHCPSDLLKAAEGSDHGIGVLGLAPRHSHAMIAK